MDRTANSGAKAKIPGYSRSSDPVKVRHSESYEVVFSRIRPIFALEGFWGY